MISESCTHNGVVNVARPKHLLDSVVFVGGLGGCGKTLLTSILGSFQRVEIQKYNYAIENVCSLHKLGKLSDDVAKTLIQLQSDLDIYNMMMSRETNFRLNDLSSVFKNPNPWRYILRLLRKGDEAVVSRLKTEKPILHITIHDLLQYASTLFLALGDRARLIEIVRHPLYMIKQWHVNMVQFYNGEANAREFSIRYEYNGVSLPWFCYGWEERYLKTENTMDRLIYMIQHHIEESKKIYATLPEEKKKRVLVISFENFVRDPWPYLEKIENLLNTKMTKRTYKELKKQKVPRKMVADGVGLPIYQKYGWTPPGKNTTEREELNQRRKFAEDHASSSALEVLDSMSHEYERKFVFQI